jgi:hypothetical protein
MEQFIESPPSSETSELFCRSGRLLILAPPWGEKETSLAKGVGGKRGKISQAKISSKGEEEREELMEPEETVTALKIREGCNK